MDIHEYQAKQLLRSYRVTTPRGEVVYTSKAAARVAEELGGQRWVVKAQIHAGGRGKAGGVKLGNSPDTIAEIADQMLGSTLVTAQTGPEGQRVNRVLVERASRIEREFYLSLVVDRDSQRIVVIASAEGGVDIEEVAGSHPERDPHRVRGPRRRIAGLPVPQGGDRDRAGQPHRLVHAAAQAHVPALPRPGLSDARGEPLHRDRGRRPGRPRREDELRRQRVVPPGRRGGAARLRGGRPQGGRGHRPRAQLHRARRLGGLHRERRRPGDGDDGRDRAPRRAPGELPRRGRRRQSREDRERLPDRAAGPERRRRSW